MTSFRIPRGTRCLALIRHFVIKMNMSSLPTQEHWLPLLVISACWAVIMAEAGFLLNFNYSFTLLYST